MNGSDGYFDDDSRKPTCDAALAQAASCDVNGVADAAWRKSEGFTPKAPKCEGFFMTAAVGLA